MFSNSFALAQEGMKFPNRVWMWEVNLEILPGGEVAFCMGGLK